jgi:hypothetical protein
MGEFVPFPVPTHAGDTPLVVPDGNAYRCSGCGEGVPEGSWLFEVVRDGMVVGLLARVAGTQANPHAIHTAAHQADGEITHRCGAALED